MHAGVWFGGFGVGRSQGGIDREEGCWSSLPFATDHDERRKTGIRLMTGKN
jgi:hypothetical protein